MSKLIELAEQVERRAWDNIAHAADTLTETHIDLSAIDFALNCFQRADALRARASQEAK